MSNDTDFKLEFSCPTREQLEHVLWYVNFKKDRWDYWKGNDNTSDGLCARLGTKSYAAVVAWGFSLEDEINVSSSGRASVKATAWANQNALGNVWISGDNGELADLSSRFAFLRVEGTLSDEYGNNQEIFYEGESPGEDDGLDEMDAEIDDEVDSDAEEISDEDQDDSVEDESSGVDDELEDDEEVEITK